MGDPAVACKGLLAAEGFLYLGKYEEAIESLSEVTDNAAGHLCSIELMYVRILLHIGKWEKAKFRAEFGLSVYPEEPEFRAQVIFATKKLGLGKLVPDIMDEIPPEMLETGSVYYDLACYEALLGDIKLAQLALDAAIDKNKYFEKIWKTDLDLQRLRK